MKDKPSHYECLKAWHKVKRKIDGKEFKVWMIDCKKCVKLAKCQKEEAIGMRACKSAVGLFNKLTS